jgi:tetratricopeptide (TPR) repeat protein
MSWEERKAAGNTAIGQHQYAAAISAYTEAIAIVDAEGKETAVGSVGRKQQHILYSNRSAAYLSRAKGEGGAANLLQSTGYFESALADGRKCIELCHTFMKGYNRTAAALEGLADYAQAIGLRASLGMPCL